MKSVPFRLWMQSKAKVNCLGKTSYGTVRKNAGSNDSVPVSLWRGRGMRSTERCCFSWLFVEFFVLKWSVRPRVGAFQFATAFIVFLSQKKMFILGNCCNRRHVRTKSLTGFVRSLQCGAANVVTFLCSCSRDQRWTSGTGVSN